MAVANVSKMVVRDLSLPICSFTTCFKGFDKVETVKQILGESAEDVLGNLKVEFTEETRYMRVSDVDGHLLVNPKYLCFGDVIDIYLDVIHELVHVKQFIDGRPLFDKSRRYVDRDTEVEAYHVAVQEARTLGFSDERIYGYLRSELLNDDDLARLAKTLNVNLEASQD